jgi:hypothetical protein
MPNNITVAFPTSIIGISNAIFASSIPLIVTYITYELWFRNPLPCHADPAAFPDTIRGATTRITCRNELDSANRPDHLEYTVNILK